MSDPERDRPRADFATQTPPEGYTEAPSEGYEHHGYGAPVIPIERGLRRLRRRGSGGGDGGDGGDGPGNGAEPPEPKRQIRIRKLRLLGILVFLGLLAAVSTLFGMMMAVVSDLPSLEGKEPADRNSVLVDRRGVRLGLLTGNQKRIFLRSDQIAPVMKQAVIAIEDRRFYTNDGVDIRGIGRALWQDLRAQGAVQGGSTITQQFVKNALAAQDQRTVFNKLREAALAYQITRKWSKERILQNYLNTIYFGNGAYGVESAARTYFGTAHPGCGEDGNPPCAQQLAPAEAAMIAGIIASPSGYDPLSHRLQAKQRRDLVLKNMLDQGSIPRDQYDDAIVQSLPTSADIQPPAEDTKYPYFTSWVKQQVVDKLGGGQEGARRAFEGGLAVQTTIDSRLQDAAQASVDAWLPDRNGPRASLVAIDNDSGEVLAMVGGDDYKTAPFNLATQGQRQPGSSFKPFILAQALSSGISPDSMWASRKMSHCVHKNKRGKCTEYFEVNNYDDAYAGTQSLRSATTFSDNSVYAQVGIKVGTKNVAHMAHRLGIRTPISHNLAMTLGGLKQGVTPLDMAHAYETLAQRGRFTYGTMSPGAVPRNRLSPPMPGPVGILKIGKPDDGKIKPVELPDGEEAVNRPQSWPVIKSSTADTVSSILSTVVTSGTARAAAIPGVFAAGKTGTTENYGDAWFVGWTDKITVAVWVGYPDELRPMETEFRGEPVAGGTYPASIWKTFVEKALEFREYRAEQDDAEDASASPPSTTAAPTTEGPSVATEPAPSTAAPSTETAPAPAQPAPEQPAPEQQAPETPAQPPAQEPSTGGTGGGTSAPPAGE
jgi:penicillin-binding protein 1A